MRPLRYSVIILLAQFCWAGAAAWAQAQGSEESFETTLERFAEDAHRNLPRALALDHVSSPDVDAFGKPVSPEARASYARILSSARTRRFSPQERLFLITLLNLPRLDPGEFRDQEALARHFAEAGVSSGDVAQTGLAGTDLWRLVRAARAAAQAYRIPPAILVCLTFRESSFNPRASAWTTSAKGIAQMTNGAVSEAIARIRANPDLSQATQAYAGILGAKMPQGVELAQDVDALTAEIAQLQKEGAAPEAIAQKRRQRRLAIASHKDEPGHIYNLETNFGLAASYLAYLRYHRLGEVVDPQKGWLTAVGAYNQGLGIVNDLIYRVFQGPFAYNASSLDSIFSRASLSRLNIPAARQGEMLGEIDSLRNCALP